MSSAPQGGYECFDGLIRQLRGAGHTATADKLDIMLHRVAWTTGSELVGELGLEILALSASGRGGRGLEGAIEGIAD